MSPKRKTIYAKIDKAADAAKRTVGKVAAATDRASDRANKGAHEVGKQLKQAGEKLMKKTDRS